MDLVPQLVSAASIASLEALSVANINDPSTELNLRPGVTDGAKVICYQAVAGTNTFTWYEFDSASSASVGAPYIIASSDSGKWVACGGRYNYNALSLASTLAVTGAATLSSTLAVTGRAAFGGGTYSADLTSIIINRAIAITPNDHGTRDESTITVASGAGGYASYDALVTFAGAATYDHLHGFQARQLYNGSGSLTDLVSLWSQPGHTGAGTVTNAKGAWIKDASGTGAITNNYGVYVEALTRGGTLNYALYTAGSTPSLFNGAVTVGGTLTGSGLIRTTTSLFEGPTSGGFTTNAYFSAGWKYRATGVAYKVQDGGSGALTLSAAVSGSADAAITWVDALTLSTTTATVGMSTASSSTSTGALVVTGGAGIGGAIFAGSIQNTPIGSTTVSTGAFSTISATGQITSTLATGTAPLVIASTTKVANLNADLLDGTDWRAPGAIGGTTPAAGSFTTLAASDVITSTLATGTAPLTVASTTVVGNLNVSQLLGSTWAAPGSIGSGTPAAGAFTTLAASGLITETGTTDASALGTANVVNSGGLSVAKSAIVGLSLTIGDGTNAGTAFLVISNAAASTSDVRLQTAGSNRWIIRKDGTSETGSNAGSNFALIARTDAGATIDTPISITRVAGGTMTLARPTSLTNTTDSTSTSTGALIVAGGVGIANAATIGGTIIGQGLIRTTTSLFEGPAAGGFLTNAYFSGGWKYRATNVAYKVQDGGSGYLVLSAAVSGTADAAITWVDSLSVGPTNIAIASATPLYVNSTTDATAVGTAALIVAGGISVAKRLILDGSTGKTLRIANATANASVATTLGSVGPTGSTAGNPQGWMRIDINGTDRYIPFW